MRRDDLESLRKRAFSAANAADLELAISLFREALAICSDEEASVVLTNISLLYHQREEWDKALLYAEQAMQAWPGNVKASFRAGTAQMRLGHPAAACSSFSTGLLFAPGHRQMLSALYKAQSLLRQELTVITSPADSSRMQDLQESATQVAMRMEDVTARGCSGPDDEVRRRLQDLYQQHQHSLRGKASKGWYECHEQEQPHPSQDIIEGSLNSELHKVLHVVPGAALPDVRAAYRRMVLAAHPDKGGSLEAFEQVQQAYRVLTATYCSTSCRKPAT